MIYYPKRKGVSQPSFFRGHVELPGYHKDCCSSWWTPLDVNQYHGMRYSLFFTRASEIFHLFGYLNRLELRWVSSDIRVLHLNSNTLGILGTYHKNLNVRDTSIQDFAQKSQWLENWSSKNPSKTFFFVLAVFVFQEFATALGNQWQDGKALDGKSDL